MATDHSHPLRLDGQRWLSRLLLWDHHDWAKIYNASTVRSRASYPPRCVFTDEQTVTGTPHILFTSWGILDWRGLVADGALDDVLVQFSVQVDERLAHATVDDWHSAGVWAGDGCVWRR